MIELSEIKEGILCLFEEKEPSDFWWPVLILNNPLKLKEKICESIYIRNNDAVLFLEIPKQIEFPTVSLYLAKCMIINNSFHILLGTNNVLGTIRLHYSSLNYFRKLY